MSAAVISECNSYRYLLTRKIAQPIRWVKPMVFVMLNPSTADSRHDDPTIRRCMGFAKREGCTDLIVVNLFALRATDPKELEIHPDPVGPSNDLYLGKALASAISTNGIVVAGWGANHLAWDRISPILKRFGPIKCLGKTKEGQPRHPLYVRADVPLEDYKLEELV